jgi:nucleoid-associated protein YgaU
VTVVVLFIVLAFGIQSLSQNKAQIDDEAAMTQKNTQVVADNRYEVSEGETLWSIAEKEYGDGFKWETIARANNITDPTTLSKGARLVVPKIIDEKRETIAPSMPPQPPVTDVMPSSQSNTQITGSTYVTVHGDYLWEIAVRAYGDGYRWVDIARANSITNPDLIFSGNELKLPRP